MQQIVSLKFVFVLRALAIDNTLGTYNKGAIRRETRECCVCFVKVSNLVVGTDSSFLLKVG